MAADYEVSLENNPKITFITSNKSQSLNNYIYKCIKKTNIKYRLCINDIWNMYVHTDTNDKYLILLNNIEIKTSNTKISKSKT